MELITRTMKDGREMVLENWSAYGHTVPAGFITDGATVPMLFWNIIPPYKNTKKAAVMHDYLLTQARTKDERRNADIIFKYLLEDAGLHPLRVWLAFLGVRIWSILTFKPKGGVLSGK